VLSIRRIAEVDSFDIRRQLGGIKSVRGVRNIGSVTWDGCGLYRCLEFDSTHNRVQSDLAHFPEGRIPE
jgi:hypothetical protein